MLKQTIQKDTTDSLKAGDSFVAGTLRMLSASIVSKEKDKKFKEKIKGDAQLTNEEIIDVVSSEIKKRKDAIALMKRATGRNWQKKNKKKLKF